MLREPARCVRGCGERCRSGADNGPGIPDEDLAYIFESFYSGSPRGGTGMGLAIVKAIVEAHGGAVSAENLAGGGASFQMWLPARVPSAPAAGRDDPH